MSDITHLLIHVCSILRGEFVEDEGSAGYDWQTIKTGVRVRFDTVIARIGGNTDKSWTGKESGRDPDRIGWVYAEPDEDIRPNDRLQFTSGETGTFEVVQKPDTAYGFSGPHHLEITVREVPPAVT